MKTKLNKVNVQLQFACFLAVSLPGTLPAQTTKKLTLGTNGFQEHGVVRGSAEVMYSLSLSAGQQLCVTLAPSNASTYMNIYPPGVAPGTGEAVFTGTISGGRAELQAKQSGDYLVQVFLMRNAARRGATSSFTLSGPKCQAAVSKH